MSYNQRLPKSNHFDAYPSFHKLQLLRSQGMLTSSSVRAHAYSQWVSLLKLNAIDVGFSEYTEFISSMSSPLLHQAFTQSSILLGGSQGNIFFLPTDLDLMFGLEENNSVPTRLPWMTESLRSQPLLFSSLHPPIVENLGSILHRPRPDLPVQSSNRKDLRLSTILGQSRQSRLKHSLAAFEIPSLHTSPISAISLSRCSTSPYPSRLSESTGDPQHPMNAEYAIGCVGDSSGLVSIIDLELCVPTSRYQFSSRINGLDFGGKSSTVGSVISPQSESTGSASNLDHVIAVACDDIRLIDLRSGSSARTLAGHGSRSHNGSYSNTTAVTWAPDISSHALVSGGIDGTIRLWDVRSSQCLATLTTQSPASQDLFGAVQWSSEWQSSHSNSLASSIETFHYEGKAHNGSVDQLLVMGQYIFSTGADQAIRCWNLLEKTQVKVPYPAIADYQALVRISISPDHKFLFVPDGCDVKIIEITSGLVVQTLRGLTDRALQCQFYSQTPMEIGEKVYTKPCHGPGVGVSVGSGSGSCSKSSHSPTYRLLTSCADGSLAHWVVDLCGQLIQQLPRYVSAQNVLPSADGSSHDSTIYGYTLPDILSEDDVKALRISEMKDPITSSHSHSHDRHGMKRAKYGQYGDWDTDEWEMEELEQ